MFLKKEKAKLVFLKEMNKIYQGLMKREVKRQKEYVYNLIKDFPEYINTWEDPRMIPIRTPNIRYVQNLSKPSRNVDQVLGKFLDESI